MAYIQFSLFGKTLQELLHQETGWISEPYWKHSKAPAFQYLALGNGRMPDWWEGMAPISVGGLWTPSIGEAADGWQEDAGSSWWQILEENVPERYYLNPVNCIHILTLAVRAGCRPPEWIEYLLLRQGGRYPSSIPSKNVGCASRPKTKMHLRSSGALEGQMVLFPPCSLDQ